MKELALYEIFIYIFFAAIPSSRKECELKRSDVRDKKLTVGAKYANTEVLAVTTDNSCAVHLKSGKVSLQVCVYIYMELYMKFFKFMS